MTFRFPLAFSFAILFFSTLFSFTSSAQTGSLSPYSRYGIGDITPEGFTHQSGMAGLGAGLSSGYNINFINPASYIADSIIVFEFGAVGEMRKLARKSESSNYNSASFAYFSLAFPIVKNKLSAAFGLLPYSSVGYNLKVEQDSVPDIGTVRYLYEGQGGFNKFFIGTGVKITPKLSAGINASYVFGTINHIRSVEFPYSANYYNSRYVNSFTAKGLYLNYGLMYETKLKNELDFKAGLTGSVSSRLNTFNNQYYFNYVVSPVTGGETIKDSVQNETETRGKIQIPDYIRAGFTIGKSQEWTAGLDVSYTNWDSYKSFETLDSLKNSYTIHIGAEKIGQKSTIRLGARYGTTYINLNNTQLQDYGITFGLGIHKISAKRPPSTINIAIEAGQRGTVENDLIREQYIKLHLGFTLTDIWFIKPKYD